MCVHALSWIVWRLYNSLNQRQDVLVTFAHWTKTSKEKYSEISFSKYRERQKKKIFLRSKSEFLKITVNPKNFKSKNRTFVFEFYWKQNEISSIPAVKAVSVERNRNILCFRGSGIEALKVQQYYLASIQLLIFW